MRVSARAPTDGPRDELELRGRPYSWIAQRPVLARRTRHVDVRRQSASTDASGAPHQWVGSHLTYPHTGMITNHQPSGDG